MSQLIYSWEKTLHDLALDALHRSKIDSLTVKTDDEKLRAAYQYCENLTKKHSRTFFMASALLPEKKRKAARALYAFCRVSDDLVDCGNHDLMASLEIWRQHSLHDHIDQKDEVILAWSDTHKKFKIPKYYGEQLIQGVAQDVVKNRYENFEELSKYCYSVASTVGLMSMFIVGFKNDNAFPYAIRLGVALQLTNILRDIGEDWQKGRLYLPKDELQRFDIKEQDIEAGIVNDKWRAFMRFQIERNRRLYLDSMPGIALLSQEGRFAIGAAAELYQKILDEIEKNDYNVFTKRAFVKNSKKLLKLPIIWVKSTFGYPSNPA